MRLRGENAERVRRKAADGALVAVGLLLAGCSAAPPITAVEGGSTSVGSLLAGRADAPDVCHQLADSKSLTDLASNMPEAVANDNGGQYGALEEATSTLRRLDDQAPAPLGESMRRAGDALDAVSADGFKDSTKTEALSSAFQDLGDEVQAQCDFPLG